MTESRVFTDPLLNSFKTLPRFSPGSEGKENMFYFLNGYLCSFEALCLSCSGHRHSPSGIHICSFHMSYYIERWEYGHTLEVFDCILQYL